MSLGCEDFEPTGETKQVSDFGSGAERDNEKLQVVPRRPARAALHDIGRDRDGGAAQLRLKAEAFLRREVLRLAIDLDDQFVRHREDFQLAMISAHVSPVHQVGLLLLQQPMAADGSVSLRALWEDCFRHGVTRPGFSNLVVILTGLLPSVTHVLSAPPTS